jgi:acyl carrier protein
MKTTRLSPLFLLASFALLFGCDSKQSNSPNALSEERCCIESPQAAERPQIPAKNALPKKHPLVETSADIEKWLRVYVAKQYDLDPTKIDSKTPLISYGDELNAVEVVMEVEDKYDITIPDELFMDKNANESVGLYKDLTILKLVDMIERLKTDK